MSRLQHNIRKQTIEIEVASEALALALQSRLGDLNRRYFLPVIERVFDDFSVPGRQIKIFRLDLDLGDVPFDRFAEVATERFDAELRRVLEEALRRQKQRPTPDNYSQTESASRLELIEYYLQHGTLPFWAAHGSPFSFEQLVSDLAEEDSASLIRVIKRHASQRSVLERLVRQLGEATLQLLLRLLEPEHAVLIIACLNDLRLIHRAEPVVKLSENEFARSLWILVLTYVLRESGSQFNRKSFVKKLLESLARDEGVEYEQILLVVQLGLQRTIKRQPLESSLPGIVSEITHELNLDTYRDARAGSAHSRPDRELEERDGKAAVDGEAGLGAESHTADARKQSPDQSAQTQAASQLDVLEYYLLHGTVLGSSFLKEEFSFERFLMEVAANDPAGLRRVIREHGNQMRVIERFVFQLGEESLRRLTYLLEPEHAAQLIAFLTDLRVMHRGEPVLRLSDNEFAHSLWILAFSYLTQEPGSQFNLKSFVESLLEKMADSEGLDYTEIVAMFHFGLRQTAKNRPLESSLQAVIDELLSEFEEGGFRSPSQAQAGEATLPGSPIDHSKPGDKRQSLSDLLAQLESYLNGEREAASDGRQNESEGRELFRVLAAHDTARVRQLIRQFARRPKFSLQHLVDRLLRVFSPENILAILAPEQRQFIVGLATVFREVGARLASAGSRPVLIYDLFWKTALEYLLSDSSSRWHRRLMVRQMVTVVAERVDASPAALADTLSEELAQTAGTEASLVWAVEEARQFLRNRPGSAGYAQPAFARYDHVEVIRYYLRYGVLPWSAQLRNPEMTAASTLAFLPLLPRSLLCTLFTPENHDQQLQALSRATLMMSEASIVQLLRALLSQARESDSAFWSALSAVVSGVEDKQAFYARLLAAILNGDSLDLEEFASAVAQPITIELLPAGDPAEWDVDVLKSVLANRLRSGDTSNAGEHTGFSLLSTLVDRYPEDTQHFCLALRDTPDLMAALAQQCTSATLDQLVDLLRPADSQALEILLPDAAGTEVNTENFQPAHFSTAAMTTAGGTERVNAHKPQDYREAALAMLLGGGRKSHIPGESREETVPLSSEFLSDDALQHTLAVMLEKSPQDVYALVTEQVQDSRIREHWARTLPESTLARLSYLLEPQKHRSLLDAGEVLVSAWLEVDPSRGRTLAERQTFWNFLLEFLDHTADANRSVEGLAAAFFEDVAARYRVGSSAAPDFGSVGARILDSAARLAKATGQTRLEAVLRSERTLLLAPWEPSASTGPRSAADLKNADRRGSSDERRRLPLPDHTRMAFSLKAEKEFEAIGEPVYIGNAGLVLTGPFLPHLFETLDLLREDENGRTSMRDGEAISRSVHLLQYLVDGWTSAPEPLLVLNKILCGVPVTTPVDREIDPTEGERAVCERLLRAMIANWTSISNTSIAGLQETFFRRDGKLERRDGEWRLRIQRKTVDVLVDQIPWTVSVIYHRWMPQPLYVDW